MSLQAPNNGPYFPGLLQPLNGLDPSQNALRTDDLPEEVQKYIQENQDKFEGPIDTEEEARQLLQAMYTGQIPGAGMNLQPGEQEEAIQQLAGKDMQELLALLVDAVKSGLMGNQSRNQGSMKPQSFGNATRSAGGHRSWRPSGNGRAGGSPGGSPGGTTSGASHNRTTGAAPRDNTVGENATLEQMKERTPPDLRARAEQVDPSQIPHYDKRSPKAQWGARVAVAMGLRITDTTDGTPGDGIHSNSSHHYDENHSDGRIHAIDVGGDSATMGRYFDMMKQIDPGSTELFYDPRGGVKNGRQIAAIGGHGNHVHYAG